ncbi:MAG: hypothetical protein MR393_09760, partial [Intestinimonas massiliensis]|nr:hypothetical protein [Intestinimonas massiliensis (ex Afouda et al. 2020)]
MLLSSKIQNQMHAAVHSTGFILKEWNKRRYQSRVKNRQIPVKAGKERVKRRPVSYSAWKRISSFEVR